MKFSFRATPVFLNVGINEEATLASKLGRDALQHAVNLEGYQVSFVASNVYPFAASTQLFNNPYNYGVTTNYNNQIISVAFWPPLIKLNHQPGVALVGLILSLNPPIFK